MEIFAGYIDFLLIFLKITLCFTVPIFKKQSRPMVFRKTDVLRPATLLEDSVAGVSCEIFKNFQNKYTIHRTKNRVFP